MSVTSAIPGVHPKLNAVHVRERLDELALQTGALASHVATGALRFARPAEREAVRDAAAMLADALIGLAQRLDSTDADALRRQGAAA
jgi:hypothetical protein